MGFAKPFTNLTAAFFLAATSLLAAPPARAQSTQESINLSLITRTLTSSAVDMLGGRLTPLESYRSRRARERGGDPLNFAPDPNTRAPDYFNTALPQRPRAPRTRRAPPPRAPRATRRAPAPTSRASRAPRRNSTRADGTRVGIWSALDIRTFAGSDHAAADVGAGGNSYTGFWGADWLARRWLGGVAVSYTTTEGHYLAPAAAGAADDTDSTDRLDVDAWMAAFYPYLRVRVFPDLDVWAMLGFGWGELTQATPAAAATAAPDKTKSQTAAQIYALGAEWNFFHYRDITLTTKSEFAISQNEIVTAPDPNDPTNKITSRQWQQLWRIGIQAEQRLTTSPRVTIHPVIGANFRLDRGGPDAGEGLEFAGGARYTYNPWRLDLEARGRGLVVHSKGIEEWGVSLLLRTRF